MFLTCGESLSRMKQNKRTGVKRRGGLGTWLGAFPKPRHCWPPAVQPLNSAVAEQMPSKRMQTERRGHKSSSDRQTEPLAGTRRRTVSQDGSRVKVSSLVPRGKNTALISHGP